jgi:hypothetical protein
MFLVIFHQRSFGSQTKLLLNYSCIDINSPTSKNIIKELKFFISEKLLEGETDSMNLITIKDFLEKKEIEPIPGDQYLYSNESIVVLKRGKSPLGMHSKRYISFRLAGVSPALALKLVSDDGTVVWGDFKVSVKHLTKLDLDTKKRIQFLYDFRSSFFDNGQLFYVSDGEIIRILLVNENLTEVLWESALDSKNFHDSSFNSLIEGLLSKNKFSMEDVRSATGKILMLDKDLRKKLNLDWINPVQITLLKNIQPIYVEEE